MFDFEEGGNWSTWIKKNPRSRDESQQHTQTKWRRLQESNPVRSHWAILVLLNPRMEL